MSGINTYISLVSPEICMCVGIESFTIFVITADICFPLWLCKGLSEALDNEKSPAINVKMYWNLFWLITDEIQIWTSQSHCQQCQPTHSAFSFPTDSPGLSVGNEKALWIVGPTAIAQGATENDSSEAKYLMKSSESLISCRRTLVGCIKFWFIYCQHVFNNCVHQILYNVITNCH